jgi:hypothetical protein
VRQNQTNVPDLGADPQSQQGRQNQPLEGQESYKDPAWHAADEDIHATTLGAHTFVEAGVPGIETCRGLGVGRANKVEGKLGWRPQWMDL